MTLHTFAYNVLGRLVNFSRYMQGTISEFEYELRKKYLRAQRTTQFIQSYPPLRIEGLRPTHTRFVMYGLEQHLDKRQSVLDLGGNTGFFSCYLSRFVKDVTIVEQHRKTIHVGAFLARHEKLSNVSFVNADITQYTPKKQFSVVLSLSAHTHQNMKEYLAHVHSLLRPKGIFVFESHILEWERHPKRLQAVEKSKLFTVLESGFIDDNQGRMRKFYVMQKNE